jgi:peptidoglycan/xylan/chitin deacetylase (PgdA/CDA1 family)
MAPIISNHGPFVAGLAPRSKNSRSTGAGCYDQHRMRRLPLPGWLLAVSILAFVGTWIVAPRRSLSGRARPLPALPARDPPLISPNLQIHPLLDPAHAPRRGEGGFVFGQPWRVALTFDDGPHHVHTARLLDILAEHQAIATFFVNGRWIAPRAARGDVHRAVLRRARIEGHAIGSHTYTHVNLTRLSTEEQTWEIVANEQSIERVVGMRPTLFRPPYGVLSRHSLAVLRERGYVIARWNAAALDEEIHDPVTIQRTVVMWLRHHQGGIIMLHDRYRWSVEAVRLILQELRRENCRRRAAGQPTFQVVPLDSFLVPPAQSGAPVGLALAEQARRLVCVEK